MGYRAKPGRELQPDQDGKKRVVECWRSATDYVAQRELFAPARLRETHELGALLQGAGYKRWHVHREG